MRDASRILTISCKFEFAKFKVFGENTSALSSRPRKIDCDTPTIVGATIFYLAKYHMYQFNYGIKRSSFDCRLLYSVTDSLLYRINCEDFYCELKESNVLNQFDFSNCPEDQEMHSKENKRVVFKFKNKFAGDYLKEFICLKPKLYSSTSARGYFTFNNSRKTNNVTINFLWLSCFDFFCFHRQLNIVRQSNNQSSAKFCFGIQNTIVQLRLVLHCALKTQILLRKSMFYKRFHWTKYVSLLLIINTTFWMRELKFECSATTKLFTVGSKIFFRDSDEVEWDYEIVEIYAHLLLDSSSNWDHNKMKAR